MQRRRGRSPSLSARLGNVRGVAGDTFCFVHAADLHLDTPFSGIGQVAPEIAGALREASLRSFEAVIELALAREAAFVVIAGDIYDGAERGLRAQLRLRDGLGRLAAAGVASFVVHGNHDPVATGWSAISHWPEGVTVFGTGEAAVVPVVRDGTQLATVQGVSYARAETTENLARRLRRPAGPGLHVGVLHCAVEGAAAGHARYSPCTLEDLRATGLDYLALGHVHAHTVLAQGPGDPWIVYPGTTQARSVRGGELGPKGAVVVHVAAGAVAGVEFVACDAVRFELVEVDVSGLADVGALAEELDARARELLGALEDRSLVLRARLTGQSPLHGLLRRPAARDELLATVRDLAGVGEPFCWWDALIDETRPVLDRAALRARGDFAADLVRIAEEIAADPDAARALLEEAGALPRPLALVLGELADDSERLAAVLDAAADLALGTLGASAP